MLGTRQDTKKRIQALVYNIPPVQYQNYAKPRSKWRKIIYEHPEVIIPIQWLRKTSCPLSCLFLKRSKNKKQYFCLWLVLYPKIKNKILDILIFERSPPGDQRRDSLHAGCTPRGAHRRTSHFSVILLNPNVRVARKQFQTTPDNLTIATGIKLFSNKVEVFIIVIIVF